MKIGIIIYHKNIMSYIDTHIIKKCLESIENQTYKKFDVLELDYSKDDQFDITIKSLGYLKDRPRKYFRKQFDNHIEAMNFLLDKAFNELGYNIIFNINLDDIYHERRFEKQLRMVVCDNYDLVGSNYTLLKIEDYGKKSLKDIKLIKNKTPTQQQLKIKFNKNKLVIPLSSMCITKKAWKMIGKIIHIPSLESIGMCRSIFNNKGKIGICYDNLLTYRIHNKQHTQKYIDYNKLIRF